MALMVLVIACVAVVSTAPATQAATVSVNATAGYDQASPSWIENEYGGEYILAVDCQAKTTEDPGCQHDVQDNSEGLGRPVWIRCGYDCDVEVLPPYPFAGVDMTVEDETTGTPEQASAYCSTRTLACGPT